MRAVVLTKHGPPEALQVQERPDPPPPEAGEVTVAIAATGVAFSEVAARLGIYPPAPKPPTVLGTDIAGTVAAVGAGVDSLSAGDRVFGVTRYGGYAERANTLADNLRRLPERLSFEQGAAIGINYATAWLALVSHGGIRYQRGARVLLHAAAGGVGIAATQIAKRYGAEVWGTASASKHDAIRGLGVDHAVDYRVRGWDNDLPSFDVILDPIGGPNWKISYRLLRPGGRTIVYGASAVVADGRRSLRAFAKAAVQMPRRNLLRQMWDSKAVVGLMMPTLWDDRGSYGPFLEPLLELIDDGAIDPVIDATFGFDEAPEAHRRLADRRNVGKVVLTAGG
jgi:NADPH:quinone reductase-like Zn-dependent oxidoreductase